jgi:hypothetical protein
MDVCTPYVTSVSALVKNPNYAIEEAYKKAQS